MKYFLIIIVIALVLSPIIGLRASPRQKRIESVRRRASGSGIGVQLARRPDAREDERDLSSVSYRLPWGGAAPDELRPWTLIHNGSRGMEAEWPAWRWFEGPASNSLLPVLTEIVSTLPEGVTGLKVDRAGLALHWDESGGNEDVDAMVNALQRLRSVILGT